MKKKFAAFALCLICLLSAAGCGQAKTDTQTPPTADQSAVTDDYLTHHQRYLCGVIPRTVEIRVSEYLDRCHHADSRR